jgi:hypothetical protein
MIMFKLKSYGKSVKGRIIRITRLFAVADGVTNYPDGKEASRLAINYLNELFGGDLVKALYSTNLKILEDKLTDPNIGYYNINFC